MYGGISLSGNAPLNLRFIDLYPNSNLKTNKEIEKNNISFFNTHDIYRVNSLGKGSIGLRVCKDLARLFGGVDL